MRSTLTFLLFVAVLIWLMWPVAELFRFGMESDWCSQNVDWFADVVSNYRDDVLGIGEIGKYVGALATGAGFAASRNSRGKERAIFQVLVFGLLLVSAFAAFLAFQLLSPCQGHLNAEYGNRAGSVVTAHLASRFRYFAILLLTLIGVTAGTGKDD